MVQRRNLIIVVAHGLRSDVLSDSAAWPLMTPNFVKMSERGLRLVANSACPSDWGGLTSLLTGLYARQHGQLEPTVAPAVYEGWASWLREAGYFVSAVGCCESILPWADESVLVERVEKVESERCRYLAEAGQKGILKAVQQQRRQRLRSGPFEPDRLLLQPEDDIDGFIINKAREAIGGMPSDRQWAVVVMLSGPANDLPPPMMYDHVADTKLLEGGLMPADLANVDLLAELDYPRVMLQRLESQQLARIRADYLGRVSLIDYGIGRFVSGLNARGDRERTWVVVTSERGQLLGEHGLVGHRSFLCPAVEVPVVIAPPVAMKQREYETSLISVVDVAATIAALGGCDTPRACPGRSLLGMIYGEEPAPRAAPGCISEFGDRLMLDTGRYKVIFNTQSQMAIGLYDLVNDPDEKKNLVTTAEGLNMLDSMRMRLGYSLLPLRSAVGETFVSAGGKR